LLSVVNFIYSDENDTSLIDIEAGLIKLNHYHVYGAENNAPLT